MHLSPSELGSLRTIKTGPTKVNGGACGSNKSPNRSSLVELTSRASHVP